MQQEGKCNAEYTAGRTSPSVLLFRPPDPLLFSYLALLPHELHQVFEQWGAVEVFLYCDVPKEQQAGDGGIRLAGEHGGKLGG